MHDIIELNGRALSELKDIAKELSIPKFESLKKQDLIYKILDTQAINSSTPPDAKMKSKKSSEDKKTAANKSHQKETPVQKTIEDASFENETNARNNAPETKEPLRTEHSYHEEEKFSLPVDPVISPGDTRGDTRNESNGPQPQQQENSRHEKRVEVNFDGIVEGEGVLEIMPD